MSWFDLLGYAASLSVLATFYMSTMVPLRMMALGSNVLFASYGLLGHIYPVLILHVVLFPVNLYRLVQIHNLIRDVRSASSAGISIDALLPFMRRWVLHAGDILFRKGDAADRLYYVCTGSLEISEIGTFVGPGAVIGEIGIFAPDQKRTATVVCREDAVVCELSGSKTKELYYQDPSFGFAVLRLIISRLVSNQTKDAPASVVASVSSG
jgi:hypothetical protein